MPPNFDPAVNSVTLRVLLLTRYPRMGASSRVRFLQYISGLRQFGIEVEPAPFWSESHLHSVYDRNVHRIEELITGWLRRVGWLCRLGRYDLVWVEKEILPWLPQRPALWAFRNVPLVVDFDDAWHLRYARMPAASWFFRENLEGLARRASIVTTANPVLERWAQDAGALDVVRLPSAVDTNRYKVAPRPADAPFTIGWIGTPLTADYLADIAGALGRILAQQNTRLLVVGIPRFSVGRISAEAHPWSEATEVELLQKIDVGIMPLRDGAWERAKSAYKLLQYFAVGRPGVASPVGMSKEMITPGVTGFWASSEDEWVTVINTLRSNPEFAGTMGAAGRRLVETSYSVETQLPQVAALLKRAAARPS